MNTLNSVYETINKLSDKTELAKHEVELSVINEFDKAYQEAIDLQAKAEINIVDYNELAASIQTLLNQTGQKFLRANAIYQEIEQMAKELGVEPSNILKNKKGIILLAIKEIDAYNKKLTSNKVNI